jgi:probable F420-dependent oxidoreductase
LGDRADDTPLVGVHYRATDLSMPLAEFADACVVRGLTSLYFAEHTHFPVVRRSRIPGVEHDDGAEAEPIDTPALRTATASLSERYQRIFDPYIAMAYLAGISTLRLGTCISLVAEHDAIALAKAIATLDHLCRGRLVLGVGEGWLVEEFEDHGYRGANRRAVLREKIQLMKEIWTNDVAEFSGTFVSLKPSYSWPKPVQVPHPPILFGCRARRAGFREIAAWADGWLPQNTGPSAHLADDVRILQDTWAAAGRSGAPTIVVMQGMDDADGFSRAMDTYAAVGVAEVLLDVPTDTAEVLLPLLDAYRQRVDAWRATPAPRGMQGAP